MSESIAPTSPEKIYKLRNVGGIESWFSEADARAILSKPENRWTTVEVRDAGATSDPVETTDADAVDAPTAESAAASSAETSAPEAPKKEKRAKNGR